MQATIRSRQRQFCVTAAFVAIALGTHAFGQTIQIFPIRSAPLGSPAGTVGDPVTPQFNAGLGCWEVQVNGGVEVDLDLQGSGWGNAAGSPTLGAIVGTVVSAGYSNGIGGVLNPKGWPASPGDGAYQARRSCELGGNGAPCTQPFDFTCVQQGGGTCVDPSPRWIMYCTPDLPAINTATLDYAWAVAGQVDCVIDDGMTRTFGGLILEVPLNALGTYVIAPDPDPNKSFMTSAAGMPIPVDTLLPACITIVDNGEPGRCCYNIGPDVVCEEVTPAVCQSRPGPRIFEAGETCDGPCPCPTCLSDAGCDDGNDCTADSCDECGQCVNTKICPEMRLYPIRSAALGSPPGTVGNPVTPDFNSELGCWELEVIPGVEVDIDVQAGGWGRVPGNPVLESLQAAVEGSGYSSGAGADLSPKGWPDNTGNGAYQAIRFCGAGGDHSPCVPPFDVSCDGLANGFCIPSEDWIYRPSMAASDIPAYAVLPTMTYYFGDFAQDASNCFDPDPDSFGSLGGLIVDVPYDAGGTYVIDFDPDANATFFNTSVASITSMIRTPVCITVLPLTMNRYLKFVPHESVAVAYKLDMVSSLFHPDAFVSGWVGAPDANGIASLEPAPVTREWTESVIYITGCEITPVADFELRASDDDGATFLPPVSIKTADQPSQSRWWGDLVGDFNGTVWTPPNGVTNINDALAIHKTWQQYPNAPHFSRTDVAPQVLNRVVNAEDLFFVLQAFKGEPYPFGCPDDPCEENMFEPCP